MTLASKHVIYLFIYNTRLKAAAGRSSMLEALELTFYSISHAIQTSRKIKEDYAIIIALPLHSHRRRLSIPAHKHSTPRQGFRPASQNPCPKAKHLCSYAKAVYPLQPEYSNFISIQYADTYL